MQYILSAENWDKIKELDRKTKQTELSPITYHPIDTTIDIGYFISSPLF